MLGNGVHCPWECPVYRPLKRQTVKELQCLVEPCWSLRPKGKCASLMYMLLCNFFMVDFFPEEYFENISNEVASMEARKVQILFGA